MTKAIHLHDPWTGALPQDPAEVPFTDPRYRLVLRSPHMGLNETSGSTTYHELCGLNRCAFNRRPNVRNYPVNTRTLEGIPNSWTSDSERSVTQLK